MVAAEEIAQAMLECGPLAIRAIKKAALSGKETSLEEGLDTKLDLWHKLRESEDSREGPRAFIEKRKHSIRGADIWTSPGWDIHVFVYAAATRLLLRTPARLIRATASAG